MTQTHNVPEGSSGTPSQAGQPGVTIADWQETYVSARLWVTWNARRRWPDFPVNNDVWALSVACWEHNGRVAS